MVHMYTEHSYCISIIRLNNHPMFLFILKSQHSREILEKILISTEWLNQEKDNKLINLR